MFEIQPLFIYTFLEITPRRGEGTSGDNTPGAYDVVAREGLQNNPFARVLAAS
jgi:hypothetical protein